jgi:hypothetical protein
MSDRERELELVRRARSGDGTAFEQLLAEIEPGLKDFLRGSLRSSPHVALDEVLQEVRLYLFQRLDRYNPEYPIGVFARGLARNVVKRFIFAKSDLLPAGSAEETDESDGVDLSPLELGQLPLTFRQVMGEGRFERPDGPVPPSRTFLELFEVFARYGGYPHQQVAFGYSILLWGREKRLSTAKQGDEWSGERVRARRADSSGKVPVTGDPDRVVKEVGPRRLRPAAGEMLTEVGRGCGLDGEYLGRVRSPLEARLGMTGDELFRRDPASRERHRDLREREIGGTRLEEYYGSDPRRSVADWTHAVKNRVKKVFLDPEAGDRLPLPQADGTPAKGGVFPP